MTSTIRVLIADDQRLVRNGLRLMLEQQPDIVVCGEAADGVEAVALTRELHPDVVLMDVRMPGLDGIGATRQLVGNAAARVLILTTFDIDDYVIDALRYGASGYLLKDAEPEELIAAVRSVAAGDLPLAPVVLRRVVAAFVESSRAGVDPRVDRLSPREREILVLLGQGMTNAEICDRLVVSMPTVKTHVANVLAKLDVRDRVQAAIFAQRNGLTG